MTKYGKTKNNRFISMGSLMVKVAEENVRNANNGILLVSESKLSKEENERQRQEFKHTHRDEIEVGAVAGTTPKHHKRWRDLLLKNWDLFLR